MSANWFLALPVPTKHWYPKNIPEPPENVRLIRAENIHLTIAFLGDVGESAALRAWQENHRFTLPPIDIHLRSIEGFGNPKRPALAATLAKGQDIVERAITACRDDILTAAGCPAEKRPARAHITLARPRRKSTPQELQNTLYWASSVDLSTVCMPLTEIALYTWSNDEKGFIYKLVERRPLKL
ncbi:MAG: RNA 2',3'-cyclic phosphodiesterase [Myxococcota bacterium]|jgi:2'-5' RNA ligase|nr:RNA 2',3'-cyclic phosphodiesterase [Myxococcota bacterium]